MININNDNIMTFKKTTDSHGRLIMYTEIGKSKAKKAFENCDFITLPKADANKIANFLNRYVDTHGGDNILALGNAGNSLEKLMDRLNGIMYNVSEETNSNQKYVIDKCPRCGTQFKGRQDICPGCGVHFPYID